MKTSNKPVMVANRKTFDGISVSLDSEGYLWFISCRVLGGRMPMDVAWRLIDDLCLYTAKELPSLIRSAKRRQWRPFRLAFPPEANAIFRAVLLSNGLTVNLRMA
jgi:hypothetical protein